MGTENGNTAVGCGHIVERSEVKDKLLDLSLSIGFITSKPK